MKGSAFRSPVLPCTAMLWLGCMQHPTVATIGGLMVLGVCRHKPHQLLTLLACLATGWAARSLHQWMLPELKAPVASIWKCTSAGDDTHPPTFSCTSHSGNAYGVEWPLTTPPPATPFFGTLHPHPDHNQAWRIWKHSRGIHGTLRPLREVSPNPVQAQHRSGAKVWLWHRFQDHFSGEVPGLLLALSSGDKRHLDTKVKRLLGHAGLAHLMAVSGYHVGLVSSLAAALLRRKRQSARWAGLAGIGLSWAFIGFCGWPHSAVRAGWMLTGYAASQLLRMPQSAMHIMSLAAWWMLLEEPGRAVDLGTQLSFLAVFSILQGIQILERLGMMNAVWIYIAVPVAAQWGTGLVAWPKFGLFPLYFLLFNALAPPVMAVVGICLISMLASEWMLGQACWMEWATTWCDRILNHLIATMMHAHGPHWTVDLRSIEPALLQLWSGLFLAGGVVFLSVDGARRRLLWITIGAFLASLPWAAWQLTHRTQLHYRWGLVARFHGWDNPLWVTHDLDVKTQTKALEKFNAANLAPIQCSAQHTSSDNNGNWMMQVRPDAGIGQQKSRPFAWRRTGSSTLRCILGQDTVHLERWDPPVMLE